MPRVVLKPTVAAALVAALVTGCSDDDRAVGDDASSASAPDSGRVVPSSAAAPSGDTSAVPEARLREMLLTSGELGHRFATVPGSEDGGATKIKGCSALDQVVGGEATAEALDLHLAHEASVTFSTSTTPVELAQRVGSDTPERLEAAAAPVEALAECGRATFVAAQGDIPVTFTKRAANVNGVEGSSYLMTFSGQEIQLTVLRVGPVLMSLSGEPRLVDGLLPAAVAKVTKSG